MNKAYSAENSFADSPNKANSTMDNLEQVVETEQYWGVTNPCVQKLTGYSLFGKLFADVFVCVKSCQTGDRILFGDILHFPNYDSVDEEVLWVFVGGKLKASSEIEDTQYFALYFVEKKFYDNKYDNPELYLLLADTQAFREGADLYGSVCSEEEHDAEYFQLTAFVDLLYEDTLFFAEGQYETESSELETSKFKIIGDLKRKGSNTPAKANKKVKTVIESSPFTNAVKARQAAVQEKNKVAADKRATADAETLKKVSQRKNAGKKGKPTPMALVSPVEELVSPSVATYGKRKRQPKKDSSEKDTRPRPFINFCVEQRKGIGKEKRGLTFAEITKELTTRWHNLSDAEKVTLY